jgi:pilus assembly protein CpaE
MTPSDVVETRMTLLFVCISDEMVQTALNAADEQHWSVAQVLFDMYISAHRRPHLPEALRSGNGCIAFINFDLDPEQAKAAAHYLQQIFHNRIVIMAASAIMDTAKILAAMQAGCSEFLTDPVQEHAVQGAFNRAGESLAQRAIMPAKQGSVLALLGAKGGVGTTTLGVHLAIYLVQNNKQKVLLIDSKIQFGHVCIYLGIDGSEYHFQEVVSNVNRLDSELLQAFVGHHSSGLHLLSSPDLGQTARPMHPDDVALTLEFLRTEYDFIIIDGNDSADAITRAIIASASQVYLVATPDITAIRDLSRHVDDLSRMHTSCQIQVVINRYSSQFAVNLQDIEKAIRMPVSFSVPNNYIELVRSANIGEPVSVEGKSGFTAELLKWAHSLVGTMAIQPAVPYAGSAPKTVWESVRRFLPRITAAPLAMNSTGKGA